MQTYLIVAENNPAADGSALSYALFTSKMDPAVATEDTCLDLLEGRMRKLRYLDGGCRPRTVAFEDVLESGNNLCPQGHPHLLAYPPSLASHAVHGAWSCLNCVVLTAHVNRNALLHQAEPHKRRSPTSGAAATAQRP